MIWTIKHNQNKSSNPLKHAVSSLENIRFSRDFFCIIIEKLTNFKKQTESKYFRRIVGKSMGVTWKKVEKNIYQSMDNPKKYKVVLYFGRDERNKLISSSKVIEGNLTEARKILKLHEAELKKRRCGSRRRLCFENYWTTGIPI